MKKTLSFFGTVMLLTFSLTSFAQTQTGNSSGVPGENGYPPQNNNSTTRSINPSTQDGNGNLGNTFAETKCGLNFMAISNKLGQRFTPAGVPQPAAYNVSGLSPCDSIEKAYLYVEGSGTGAAQTAIIQPPIGGPQNFPMTLIGTGPDKCWGYAGSVTYRADVTGVINGNGAYLLSNIFTNPPNAGEDMDGATLIIIYSDKSATYQGTLTMDDGAMISTGFNSLSYNMNFAAPCGPTANEQAFCCIGDLQNPSTTITMNGTPTPYVYDWWNYLQVASPVTAAQTTANFTAAANGDCYNLCVVGMYWQTTSCTVCPLNQIGNLSVAATSTQTSCSSCTGTATANPTPSGVYTYLWTPSSQTTQTATNLCAGTYTVTVTGTCLTATTTITVPTSSSITSTSVQTNAQCNGGTGSTTVTPVGGLGPYTYSWAPTGGNGATASGLTAGTYTCTITDANGCTTEDTVTIAQPPQLTSTSTNTNVLCNGQSTGSGSITATGGTPGYTYSWAPSGGTNASASSLAANVYTVTATDANGCVTTQTITITQPPILTAALVGDSVCLGGSTQISASGNGGVGPYTYAWSNGPTTQVDPINSPASTTTYTVTVTDANGCTTTGSTTVTVNPLPVASITSNAINGVYAFIPNQELCFYGPTAGIVAWAWVLQPGLSNLQNPCVPITAADTGSYCATLIVENSHGCTDTASTCVEIVDVSFSIPNVFTPNADGTNDVFTITNTGMKTLHCVIYDRWGVLINEWDTPTGSWDGKTKGGKEAVDGVYYWTADMTDYSGKDYNNHGFVHLIRGTK